LSANNVQSSETIGGGGGNHTLVRSSGLVSSLLDSGTMIQHETLESNLGTMVINEKAEEEDTLKREIETLISFGVFCLHFWRVLLLARRAGLF
jgi:hypothetical protein